MARAGGEEGGPGLWSSGMGCSSVARVVATRKQAHALLIKTSRECLTRRRVPEEVTAPPTSQLVRKFEKKPKGRPDTVGRIEKKKNPRVEVKLGLCC